MKWTISSSLLYASSLFAVASSFAVPQLDFPRERGNDGTSYCQAFKDQGVLIWQRYDNQDTGLVALNARRALDAAPKNVSTTDPIIVQFDQCDFPFLGLSSGTSRNRGGSMGAPLEYFGHVRRVLDNTCLTVDAASSNGHPSIPSVKKSGGTLHFRPCQTVDNDEQLRQSFVFQISASLNFFLGFNGAKNTSKHVYDGANDYELDTFGRIRVNIDGSSTHALQLQSS